MRYAHAAIGAGCPGGGLPCLATCLRKRHFCQINPSPQATGPPPNTWEKAHGLNLSNAKDRNEDHDSNGYTNLEEYLHAPVVLLSQRWSRLLLTRIILVEMRQSVDVDHPGIAKRHRMLVFLQASRTRQRRLLVSRSRRPADLDVAMNPLAVELGTEARIFSSPIEFNIVREDRASAFYRIGLPE